MRKKTQVRRNVRQPRSMIKSEINMDNSREKEIFALLIIKIIYATSRSLDAPFSWYDPHPIERRGGHSLEIINFSVETTNQNFFTRIFPVAEIPHTEETSRENDRQMQNVQRSTTLTERYNRSFYRIFVVALHETIFETQQRKTSPPTPFWNISL